MVGGIVFILVTQSSRREIEMGYTMDNYLGSAG